METTVFKTKSSQLATVLRKDILSGKYPVGSRFHSENDLSRHYELSYTTVREALSTLVHEGLVTRSQGKGTFVTQPEPELSAKEIVGLAIATRGHIFESFSSDIVRGLMEHDLFPLTVDMGHDSKKGYRRTKILIEKQPPFLIIDLSVIIPELFSILKHYKGHAIFVLRGFYGEAELPGSYVLSDMLKGASMAAEHLLSAGYRRIIHYTFTPQNQIRDGLDVEAEIQSVLKTHGLPESTFSWWLEEEGESAIEKRLKKRKLSCSFNCPR